jgi:hypothetical protein
LLRLNPLHKITPSERPASIVDPFTCLITHWRRMKILTNTCLRYGALASFLYFACGSALTDSFTPAADMIRGGWQQADAELQDGKVLLIGGIDETGSFALANTQMFDPVSEKWNASGSMKTPRAFHTAVTLKNGKVLVAGGGGGTPEIPETFGTAELYDPTTGEWSETGSLLAPRAFGSMICLPNGKVLMAGGSPDFTGSFLTASSEVYDPEMEKWIATGPMTSPRVGFYLCLLKDGKVFAASGRDETGALTTTAEIYDPATGKWSATTSLPEAGVGQASMLADGRILFGGSSESTNLTTRSYVYDPTTTLWTQTGDMSEPRVSGYAVLLTNGKVICAGGANSLDQNTGFPISSVDIYDPATGTWSLGPELSMPRLFHVANLLINGKVLYAGGFNGAVVLETAELYDAATATGTQPRITEVARMPDGAFQLGFTNVPGATFTVHVKTDVTSTGGVLIGAARENSPGKFQFKDQSVEMNARRFYYVRTHLP